MHQTEQKRYSKTTALVLCGIFAALMAICSFITIPLGFTPVPINLATLGVFLTGGILGKKYGSISLIVYILLGAVGVPVFAGFKGEFVVIVGPSGAGKTTVLNILGGMDTASTGRVLVDGKDIAKYSPRKLTGYRRDDIGFVFQFYNLIPNLTALENVD